MTGSSGKNSRVNSNYSSQTRLNYLSRASRSSSRSLATGTSGSGDHVPSTAEWGRGFGSASSYSSGTIQQDVSKPVSVSSSVQTPMTARWNTNYVSQHFRGTLPKTDLKGRGATRVSPRVYSTILKHPQGSHYDRIRYNGRTGLQSIGLSREAQKDYLANKNAEAGWGSSGGRGGILPGLIGRVPGPPKSLMSLEHRPSEEENVNSTPRLPRRSSTIPLDSELVSRTDDVFSDNRKATSLGENTDGLRSSSRNTLVSTSPWDASPEDPRVKLQKNKEYRAYLEHQIVEKGRRLEAEKLETGKHPFGPRYESPGFPHYRQPVSSLSARIPASQSALLKKYIYDNPPQLQHPITSSLSTKNPSLRRGSTKSLVSKERQEEALKNLRQSRLKVYRNVESKDFRNHNHIISPDTQPKSQSPSGNVSMAPERSSASRLSHNDDSRPAYQAYEYDIPKDESSASSHCYMNSPLGQYVGNGNNFGSSSWEDIPDDYSLPLSQRDSLAHSYEVNPVNQMPRIEPSVELIYKGRHCSEQSLDTPIITHFRNRNMQNDSVVSFGNEYDCEYLDTRHETTALDDSEISEEVVRKIAADLKKKAISKQKIWQTSDELPDRETLMVLHKTELKQQIAEKQREREEQKRKEEEEDAKLERKIQEYHDGIRRREELRKYQSEVIKSKLIPNLRNNNNE